MKRIALALLVFWLLFPAVATASETVTFRVRVLLASTQDDQVDPKIGEAVREYLKKSFGSRYSSFRQLDLQSLQVVRDATGELTLPDKSILGLRFRDVQGEFVKLTMSLGDLRTTIRIKDGGLFFQAGHRYLEGVLILAISASLGRDEKEDGQQLSTPRPLPRKESGTPELKETAPPAARSVQRPIEQ